jgi:hypothetical protein
VIFKQGSTNPVIELLSWFGNMDLLAVDIRLFKKNVII